VDLVFNNIEEKTGKEYMNKSKIFILIMTALFAAGCSSTRIIEKTDMTAVIQGIADTKYEARMFALKKAEELFGKVNETREAECSQEFSSDMQGDRVMGMSGQGSSYWSCVVFVEKE
jgi:hypothetical protein